MTHWIIAPVILPALLAPIIAFVMRHDFTLARAASFAGTLGLLAISIGLTIIAMGGETIAYTLGDWPAPFGIVLVLDRLSALMVLLTSALALVVLIHVIATKWDEKGRHFHALFQFQLMGITGAFLTGDAFNLFVFFEVLLIASYGLMIHGGGRVRLQAGLQYVVMNLAGSTLFLFALGTLYAATGTLNIADLALKVRELPVEDAALIRVAAILLMVVFAIKAALFPVQFWLPATYSNAPAPVAALFAIMTKVGAYAIIRIHAAVFGPDVAVLDGLIGDWLMPAALVTLAIGAIGVLGSQRLMPLLSFSVVASMGTMMIAVAAFTPQATTAALYYLLHSTFSAAALFLLADLVVSRRPGGDALRAEPPIVQNGLFAALFFAGAIGMADTPHMTLSWVAILLGSLLIILGFARAGSILFWKSTALAPDPEDTAKDAADETPPKADSPALANALEVAPTMAAVAALVLLSVFAGPTTDYLSAASEQLFDGSDYVNAVLNLDEEG